MISLHVDDIVLSFGDRDQGKVVRRAPRATDIAKIDLYLSKVFGATRDKSRLFKRFFFGPIVLKREIRSPFAATGFWYTMNKHAVTSCAFTGVMGYYFWLDTHVRRYRQTGGFTYGGSAEEQLVGIVVNGVLVWKADLRFILPPREEAFPGTEELYDDETPIEELIRELRR